MGIFQGLNLVAKNWNFVNVSIDSTRHDVSAATTITGLNANTSNLDACFAGLITIPQPGAPFFNEYSDRRLEESIRTKFKTFGWRREIDGVCKQWGTPQAIGICHGHALARPLRACLTELIGRKNPAPPVFITSLPVAASLAILDSGRRDGLLAALLVSGTDQVAEVTAVSVDVARGKCVCRIFGTREITRSDTTVSILEKLSSLIVPSSQVPLHRNWTLYTFHEEDWITGWQERLLEFKHSIVSRLNRTIERFSSESLADGAALFAALQQTGKFPCRGEPTNPDTKLEINDVWPRDLGVVGQVSIGGRSEYAWRKVFSGNCKLPASSCPLRFRGDQPGSIQLVEYTGSGDAPNWAAIDERFRKSLRWFGAESLSVSNKPQQPANQQGLTIEILPAAGGGAIPQLKGEIEDL